MLIQRIEEGNVDLVKRVLATELVDFVAGSTGQENDRKFSSELETEVVLVPPWVILTKQAK